MSHKDCEEWAAMIAQMQDDPSYHPTYNKKGVRTEMPELNRPLDTMDEVAYRELQKENERLKFKNEKLHEHNEKITKEIFELRQDNKKLAHEVEDRVDRMRKAGL